VSPEQLLLLVILLPLGAAVLVLLTSAWPNLRETMSLLVGGAVFLSAVELSPHVFGGNIPRVVFAEPIEGIQIALSVEPLGMLFALLASFLWVVTTIYAIGYMRGHGESNQTRFYVFFSIAIFSTLGVAFSDNLLTLFIFYEMLSLSTYPLVTHSGTEAAKKGGRVYLGILIGTSMGFFLLAILGTYLLAGTGQFTSGGVFLDDTSPFLLGLLLCLFVFGVGKAAIMPFHRWLPAAMVAPTPVSALLHAVAVVKAGVFSILKIVIYIFGFESLADLPITQWLTWLAAFTILSASIVAMRQDNLKKRLAYSTVSQLSYIILGALLANEAGIIGGTMHMTMHAFGKITLFFCAGAILVAAHKTEVSELDGLGRAMPITMGAFFLAAISIAGLPPMGGVWSKWYLVLGTVQNEAYLLLAVLLVSTLLNIYYLLAIPVRAFFKPANDDVIYKEAPLPILIAIGITVTISFLLFIFPESLFNVSTALVNIS
jgi:multicomponent Na+:H+ antiporter subunit D